MVPICRHVHVAGRVQGVGFRWHTVEAARAIGVAGWVRNLPDGRVEVWIEGEPAAVEELLAWLRHGPPASRVETCAVREATPTGLDAFRIERGSLA